MTHQLLNRIVIVAIAFLLSSNLFAQIKIKSIGFEGVGAADVSNLTDFINIPSGTTFSPSLIDSLANRVITAYKRLGYYSVKIDSISQLSLADTNYIALKVHLKENAPVVLNSITFVVSDSVYEPIYEEISGRLEKEYFSAEKIETSLKQVIEYLDKKGFSFAELKVQSLFFEYDTLNNPTKCNVTVNVNKGKLVKYDKILITGNTATDEDVILRAIRLKQGDIYSQSRIDDVPRLLNKLRFFETVPLPEFYYDTKGVGILKIAVKEKSTNSFDGVIGYVPSQKTDESGYVTGLVDITLRNLFGTGRGVALKWSAPDRNSQELEVKYLEPYLFGLPFNLNLSLYQKKQDTTYVTRKVGGDLEYLANESLSISLFVYSEVVIPTLNDYNIFTVYNSTIFSSGLSFRYDTRDDPLSPREGIYINNSFGVSTKKINGPAEFIQQGDELSYVMQKGVLDFAYYVSPFKTQVIALSVHGRVLSSSRTEISDLYKMGGARTLRGYAEDQFLAERIAFSNNEYRLLFSARSYFFGFLDAGYYHRNENSAKKIAESEAVKFGYGIGLSLETNLGILSVSFALAPGDAFKDMKIHFGIINQF